MITRSPSIPPPSPPNSVNPATSKGAVVPGTVVDISTAVPVAGHAIAAGVSSPALSICSRRRPPPNPQQRAAAIFQIAHVLGNSELSPLVSQLNPNLSVEVLAVLQDNASKNPSLEFLIPTFSKMHKELRQQFLTYEALYSAHSYASMEESPEKAQELNRIFAFLFGKSAKFQAWKDKNHLELLADLNRLKDAKLFLERIRHLAPGEGQMPDLTDLRERLLLLRARTPVLYNFDRRHAKRLGLETPISTFNNQLREILADSRTNYDPRVVGFVLDILEKNGREIFVVKREPLTIFSLGQESVVQIVTTPTKDGSYNYSLVIHDPTSISVDITSRDPATGQDSVTQLANLAGTSHALRKGDLIEIIFGPDEKYGVTEEWVQKMIFRGVG